jgi:hypothetical protein
MKTSTDVGETVGDFGNTKFMFGEMAGNVANTKFMLGRWWGTPSKWQVPRDVGSRGRGDLGGC